MIGKGYRTTLVRKVAPLLVSNNAVDLAHGGYYTYSSFIGDGMYQAGVEGDNTLLTCPRGTHCGGKGTNFTLCSPGTYQPSVGQSMCISCPIGYVCADFGMTVPRICAAGYGESSLSRFITLLNFDIGVFSHSCLLIFSLKYAMRRGWQRLNLVRLDIGATGGLRRWQHLACPVILHFQTSTLASTTPRMILGCRYRISLRRFGLNAI